jgi:hypothetical protein
MIKLAKGQDVSQSKVQVLTNKQTNKQTKNSLLVLVLLTVKHLDLWLTLSCLMRSGRRGRGRMVVRFTTTYVFCLFVC